MQLNPIFIGLYSNAMNLPARYLYLGMLIFWACFSSRAQVVASFAPSSFGECVPSTIYLTNHSTGPIASFNWDFGNGSGSSFTDPSVVYTQPGTYTITLTVTDTAGNNTSLTQNIRIYKKPRVSFEANVSTICERRPVSFSNNSTEGDTTITSWLWDYGDGHSSIYKEHSHTYVQNGNYTVKLAATDQFGCTADTTIINYINVKDRPVSLFQFNDVRSCKAPVSVSFTNITNHPSTSYLWKFSDGSTSTAISPTHSFTTLGSHSATLIATHTNGCSDTNMQNGKIEIAPLVVKIKTPNEPFCLGQKISLEEDISPKLTTPTSYTWHFPDGSTATGKTTDFELKSTLQNIKLSVSNAHCSGQESKTIVSKLPPENSSTLSGHKLCGNSNMLSYSIDTSGIDSFIWRINNSYNRYGTSGIERFDDEGQHFVQVFMRGSNGCSITYKDTIYRSNPNITGTKDTGGCVPYTLDPWIQVNGMYPIDSLIWYLDDFGMGTSVSPQPPTVSVSDTGNHYLTFTIIDSIGCRHNQSWQIGGGYLPTASYTVEKDTVCNGEILKFSNTSTLPNKPTEFYWSMGGVEGNTKEWSPKIEHYPNRYNLTHVASHYGCNDTITDSQKILVLGPYVQMVLRSDSCISSYKQVEGIIIDADSFNFYLNNVYHSNDTIFKHSFKNNDRLKLKAHNNATQCTDSIERLIPVSSNAQLDWEVLAGECAPVDIEVIRKDENLDSIKWFINDIDMQHNLPKLVTSMRSGGEVNIKLKGFAGEGCDLTLDTTIRVQGPKQKISIGQTFGCLPKTFTLVDSFWSSTTDRVWIVDGDTISSKGITTTYTLQGVKDPDNKIVSVIALAKEDSCSALRQYNYLIPGISFKSTVSDSIISCDQSLYKFNISPDDDELNKVANYSISYKGSTETNSTGNFQKILVMDGQTDTVYLSVSDKDGCIKTQSLVFSRPKPALKVAFTSSQPHSNCPPLFVEFKDASQSQFGDIVDRKWKINDEPFSALEFPSRLFSTPGYFDVSLVVTDERGCNDSLTLDSFVQIKGEKVIADFGAESTCLGTAITCKLKDGNAANLEWDMGDGSVIAGDSITYTYTDAGSYRIQLLVSDSNQCKYPIINEELTIVHTNPSAEFTAINQCANDIITLINNSTSDTTIDDKYWKIDQLSLPQNSDTIKHPTEAKDLNVQLHVSDANGCIDSIQENVKIYDLLADLKIDKSFYCLHDTIKVSDISVSDTGISSFSYFVNGNLMSEKKNPNLAILFEGEHELFLVIEDESGCIDTSVTTTLQIAGPNQKSAVEIVNASFVDHNMIRVEISSADPTYFHSYQLFDDNATLIAEEYNRLTNEFTIQTESDNRKAHCFKAAINNGCNALDIGNASPHCTVHTMGESTSMSKTLTWTPYQGWPVKSYTIFRQNNTNWDELGNVVGNELLFIDSNLTNCDAKDVYRVLALGFNGEYSLSDSVHIRPRIDKLPNKPIIQNISVVDDHQIELKIDSNSTHPLSISYYIINRKFLGTETETQRQFATVLDYEVNTQKGSYHYTVEQIDQCLQQSEHSAEARSIYLTVSNDNSTSYPVLKWNRNNLWGGEFSHYSIYKTVSGIEFEIDKIYNEFDTTYIDNAIDLACATTTCYTIEAHSKNGKWESRSNTNCGGTYSTLYVPNGITANGDLLNDHFQPRGLFIENYQLTIYNRWGEQVFKTNECMGSWNCMIDNQPAPAGTYFYSIFAIGADGIRHHSNGSLNLIR